jgi:hypothetical protein
VTAANVEIPSGELFVARIDEATASASGTPARIRTDGPDSTALVVVERRAELEVNGSTNDPDGIVTTGQNFEIQAKVDNKGDAPYGSGGEIRLTVPNGYQRVRPTQEPLTRSFSKDETLTWSIRAPSSDSGPDDFILTIVDRPKDQNTDENAFASKDIATVRVESKFSNLSITRLYVSSPSGGNDGIVSTEQFFEVTANIIRSRNLDSGRAELILPEGAAYRFVSGGGFRDSISVNPMTWRVQAPANEHAEPFDIALHLRASDQQGVQEYIADATMPVRTVNRANLFLNASIVDPPQASGGLLSPGQAFTVRAVLQNNGTAGTDGIARVRIDLGTTGVTPLDPLTRDLEVDDPNDVEWELQAPVNQASGTITVSLVQPYPLDENTGEEALRTRQSQSFPVRTGDAGSVTVAEFSISFPSGAQDGIISTGQVFQVSATPQWINADSLVARLNYPPDFLTGSPTQRLQNSGEVITWLVTAPSGRMTDQAISVTLTGNDSHAPTDKLVDTSDVILVQVIARADLRLSGRIVSPPSATDGDVSIGQEFMVEATLTNFGEARTYGEDGIYLSLPVGYTTQDLVIQPTTADTVRWQVRARDTKSPSRNELIELELVSTPLDSNTNTAAAVSVSINSSAWAAWERFFRHSTQSCNGHVP